MTGLRISEIGISIMASDFLKIVHLPSAEVDLPASCVNVTCVQK
ncbi:hypothetical protein SLEP1_g23057 [Rubroshorea leprosula]|uniref:Uncharacterized protein n=1 Tax=Rubroshorea leprosula TaxID=152421 RepID=A0AAV5JKF7_9ROSI|nr:hypothetical protein SLEP1_g23057 [Rubroshorea leprosula]